jgi:hypothetical protein
LSGALPFLQRRDEFLAADGALAPLYDQLHVEKEEQFTVSEGCTVSVSRGSD